MVSLQKGQKVNLSKDNPSMQKMIVGLGWDVNEGNGGGFFNRRSSSSADYDLDAFAIALRGGRFTNKRDLVFYGNRCQPQDAIYHTGDNLTGEGDGDDEQIIIDLSKVDPQIDKIVICVNIYEAAKRRQDFGQIRNAFIRLCDANTGQEAYRYDLTQDYSGYRGMIFGEIYRHNGDWKFNPVGEGTKEETIKEIASIYR